MLIQQIQSYLIEIFKLYTSTEQPILKEAFIIDKISQFKKHFLRKNKQPYGENEDLSKVIVGTLYGAKFFEKEIQSQSWSINLDKALVWEQNMLTKLENKSKLLECQNQYMNIHDCIDPSYFLASSNDKLEQSEDINAQNDHNNQSDFNNKSTPAQKNLGDKLLGKRKNMDLISQFEDVRKRSQKYQIVQDPIDKVKQIVNQSKEELAKNDSVEYVIGMQHSFMLLKDIIKQALKHQETKLLNTFNRDISNSKIN
ncbi:UNKNOWN [Stylonychia lemnae]|uniref:Uncharacterized protein n=1 Tax=Stylonychia lemnae TaxID=5949 RepID=A0A078A3H5_STYLE|nr:UNKNOWN [Stylonychia lemnae]|eukprot:CDW76068.1 UNKNOWN [Stylonychia lemnae]